MTDPDLLHTPTTGLPTSTMEWLHDLLAAHALLLDAAGHYRSVRTQNLLPNGASEAKRAQRRALYARVQRSPTPTMFQETLPGTDGTLRRYRRLALPIPQAGGDGTPGFSLILVLTLASQEAPSGLSERELEVFEHLGQGHTTTQIATAMQVSPKTVESYRARIKTKLNITSAPDLVRQATLWTEEALVPSLHDTPDDQMHTLKTRLEREIRSPLVALVGMAEALAAGGHTDPSSGAALLATSGQHLVRRLDCILHATAQPSPTRTVLRTTNTRRDATGRQPVS